MMGITRVTCFYSTMRILANVGISGARHIKRLNVRLQQFRLMWTIAGRKHARSKSRILFLREKYQEFKTEFRFTFNKVFFFLPRESINIKTVFLLTPLFDAFPCRETNHRFGKTYVKVYSKIAVLKSMDKFKKYVNCKTRMVVNNIIVYNYINLHTLESVIVDSFLYHSTYGNIFETVAVERLHDGSLFNWGHVKVVMDS